MSLPEPSSHMDIAKHLGAVSRVVRQTQRDGKPAHAVIASRAYATTLADLWDALTSAERIPRWFLPITGELKLGGRYQFQGNAGGEITRCDAPQHLAVTWEFGGQVSWVDVVLTPKAEGSTLLELTHVAHVPPEQWEQYGPGAVGIGWEGGLLGLGEHLTGKPALVPAESAAWMGSAEGKSFYRQCGEGWRIASIAGGMPEDAANAAAARTIAAYTGEG